MKHAYTARVTCEGRWYVAECAELQIASQGATEAEALANLREAIQLAMEPPSTQGMLPGLEHVYGLAVEPLPEVRMMTSPRRGG